MQKSHLGRESTVTLGVRCPHCESQFQLNAELHGKSIRCPNPDCREIFTVESNKPPASPPVLELEPDPDPLPSSPPAPSPVFGSVADFVTVIEVEPLSPAPPKVFDAEIIVTAKSLPPTPKAAPIQTAVKLPEAVILPGPREVAWDAAAEPAAEASKPKPKPKKVSVDDLPVQGRRKRRTVSKATLALVSIGLVACIITVVVLLVVRERQTEAKLAKEAEKVYLEGKFGEASKLYEQLQKEYPDSDDVKKYAFFARLSSARNTIGAVAARDNPTVPAENFEGFLGEFGESPFAQPDTGFGTDIVQAGQQLANAFNENAADHVKEFRKDRKKLAELDRAEKSIQQGREVLPKLERFRGSGGLSSDKVREQFDLGSGEVTKERSRLATLAPFRQLPLDPSDERIEEFEQTLKRANLTADDEAKQILALARANLRSQVIFTPERRPAVAAPNGPQLGYLAPAPAGSPDAKSGTEATADAVFGMARGVFYALDAHTGKFLWGRKLHAESADPKWMDLPVRLLLADGAIDFVLLPSSSNGQYGICARRTRTGEAIWHQTLPAAVFGQPAIIGNNLFVPLQDALGTIVHIDVVTGESFGSLALRQPLGGGLAVLPGIRADHGFLIAPGDAHRMFVLEWGRFDADNRREPLTCVRSFATKHPKDSLRVEPLITSDANNRVTFCEGDGPAAMRIRSFAMPPLDQLSQAKAEGDSEISVLAETRVEGWNWFAPITDGERVSLCTDAGSFVALGINQSGNTDAGLFRLPGQAPVKEQDQVCRSQVIAQDEDGAWVLLGRQLIRLKVAIDGIKGFRLEPRGAARSLGEPMARSQVRPALNLAYATYRPTTGNGIRMLAFDLETGATVWERQLGIAAAHPPIPLAESKHLLVDSAAGVYRIGADTGDEIKIETLAAPLATDTGSAKVVLSADAKDVWIWLAETANDGAKLRLQKWTNGTKTGETVLPILDKVAGSPIAFGDKLLVPLANGYIYRIDIADKSLGKGSVWRGANVRGAGSCYLSNAGTDGYLSSDGNSEVSLFTWPADKDEAIRSAGPWDARGKASVPALAIDNLNFVVTGNDSGGVSLFEVGNVRREPLRTWKGNANNKIPEGPVTGSFAVLPHPKGQRIAFAVNRTTVVGLDPTADDPVWIARPPIAEAGELIGWSVEADRVLTTYQSGLVVALSAKTGQWLEESEADRPVPEVAAVPGKPGQLLQANADGTVGRDTILKILGNE